MLLIIIISNKETKRCMSTLFIIILNVKETLKKVGVHEEEGTVLVFLTNILQEPGIQNKISFIFENIHLSITSKPNISCLNIVIGSVSSYLYTHFFDWKVTHLNNNENYWVHLLVVDYIIIFHILIYVFCTFLWEFFILYENMLKIGRKDLNFLF